MAPGLSPGIRAGLTAAMIAGAALLAGCSRPAGSPAAGSAAGFNLLLLTLDTTRADRLGCYGYPGAETPALDGLAARGLRFDDAVTVAPLTLPAHATILTGLDPPRHGVRDNGEYRLAGEHLTLAEVLREAGYATAAFVSAFVLDARYGLDQGFELYDDRIGASTGARFAPGVNRRSAAAVSGAAIAWLEGRRAAGAAGPFFAWVHYYDPHDPYLPPEPFAHRFAGRPYDGEIAYMDHGIGALLGALERLEARRRTLVVAVGDHGEGLGEHGEERHGIFLYEPTLRVPLIFSNPDLFDGAAVDDGVVSIADVVPTVLELLAIDDRRPRDGASLLSAGERRDRAVAVESLMPYFDHGWAPLHGLRRHGDKYILAPRPEYYDLGADPGEQRNLQGRAAGELRAARDELAAELGRRLASQPSLEAVAAAAEPLDPEAARRLEALGYLGGSEADRGGERPDPKDMIGVYRDFDRAEALSRAGRPAAALELLEKAVAASPRDRRLLRALAKVHLQLGREDDAEAVLRAYLAIKPHPDVCLLLAQILIKDRRYEEAGERLRQALELDPRHGGVHLAWGDMLALHGRRDAALAAYRRAREVDPYRAAGAAEARIARLERRSSGPAVTEPPTRP